MKGFASILFLSVLIGILVALALPVTPLQSNRQIDDTLLLRRTEMENGIDEIVREGLQIGLVANLPPETIRNGINEQLLDYLNTFSIHHHEPILYSSGFEQLTHQSYLTLLLQPIAFPLTIQQLNQNTHVLVLPVSQTVRYGEYAYTGGEFGTSILSVQLNSANHQTLFALPNGYRICGITGEKELPCAGGAE